MSVESSDVPSGHGGLRGATEADPFADGFRESVAIPAWTADGLLPPSNASQPVSPEQSPYVVSLTDEVLRFSHTLERRAVLDGFLRYRAALHGAGVSSNTSS